MPKIVDHGQRKQERAEALWRIVARQGPGAVSIRTVAAEAGWSTGALRYYFATREELLDFAIERTMRRASERLNARSQRPAEGQSLIERVAGFTEELLPLDEQGRVEFLIWQAAGESAHRDRALSAQLWNGQRQLYRSLVTALGQRPPLDKPQEDSGDEWLEAWAEYLHVFVDGLATQLMFVPDEMPPERAQALLRRFLRAVPSPP